MPTVFGTKKKQEFNSDLIMSLITRPIGDIRYVNQAGDSMEGDLDLNSNKLKKAEFEECLIHTTPVNDEHLVNKQYLDQRLQGLDAIYVNEVGDEMKGELKLNRKKLTGVPNPSEDTDAANKWYVDRHKSHFHITTDSLRIRKTIDMNSNKHEIPILRSIDCQIHR